MGKRVRFTGKNTSIWMDTTPATNYPALEHALEIDAVVIGGGMAGLMSAFFLQQAGLKVAVLEAARIATRTSGYTTAKITSAHGIIYQYLLDKFGPNLARIYAAANQEAIDKMEGLIHSFNIQCDFERLPAYTYIVNREADNEIEAEIEAAKSLALPVSFTRDTSLPFPISSAIKYEEQAKFHPRKFLLAMAELILSRGGLIFEGSPVQAIKSGSPCLIQTNSAPVAAEKVIVATNRPIYDPTGFYSLMTSRQSFTLGMKAEGHLPLGIFYGPENLDFHSLRTQTLGSRGELLIIGGEFYRSGASLDDVKQYNLLEDWAESNFPIKSFDYRWTTSDSESFDRVPMIGTLSPESQDIFVATGFTGWGMAHSVAAGMILADEVIGKRHPWSQLYSPERFPQFSSLNPGNAAMPSRGRKSRAKYEDHFTELKAGEGTVKDIHGVKVAANRDDKGDLHVASAVCAHMGCTVGWNQAEQTWDCPCHGSRYDRDGKVIHGPAQHNLSVNI